MRLSPETCRVKPLRRIKTQLLHLVGLISLLYVITQFEDTTSTDAIESPNSKFYVAAMLVLFLLQNHKVKLVMTSSGTILVNFMKLRQFVWYILGNVDIIKDNQF